MPELGARKVFRSMLTDEQREEMKKQDRVTVNGSAGGQYRILLDRLISNIVIVKNPPDYEPTYYSRLCAVVGDQPGHMYGQRRPYWEAYSRYWEQSEKRAMFTQYLAQLIMIQSNELGFRRIAMRG